MHFPYARALSTYAFPVAAAPFGGCISRVGCHSTYANPHVCRYNAERSFVRFEWLEGLLRVAHVKYCKWHGLDFA